MVAEFGGEGCWSFVVGLVSWSDGRACVVVMVA